MEYFGEENWTFEIDTLKSWSLQSACAEIYKVG